jgi:hypothetical protein
VTVYYKIDWSAKTDHELQMMMRRGTPMQRQRARMEFGARLIKRSKIEMIYDAYRAAIKRSHPSANIGIDAVHDYGGARIVFYRCETSAYIHHRVALFKCVDGQWVKDNDIIASQE